MGAGQARGQRRRVVGDHEIAGAKVIGKAEAIDMPERAQRIDDEQLGVGRTLMGLCSGNHGWLSSGVGSAAPIASRTSSAASPGRFNVEGSASGTAMEWSGVSMSPGSIDRKRMP